MPIVKTPIALAVLSAIALQASAADLTLTLGEKENTEDKIFAQKIDSGLTSIDKTFVKKFDPEGKANTLAIKGSDTSNTLLVTNKSTLDNAFDTTLQGITLNVEGASLRNSGKLTIDDKSALNISNPVAFDNSKGSIVAMGAITIKDSALTDTQPVAPQTIEMGNITLTGKSAVLTNNDQGYFVKDEANKRHRVAYDTITLKDGAQFFQTEGARDQGKNLSIDGKSKAKISGTSTWDTITMGGRTDAGVELGEKAELSTNTLTFVNIEGVDKTVDSFINGIKDKTLTVKDALNVYSFASDKDSFKLTGNAKNSSFNLKDNTKLTLGSAVGISQDSVKGTLAFNTYHQGKVILEDFDAVYTDAKPKVSIPEDDKGRWDYKHLGVTTIHQNASLAIQNNRTEADISKKGYHASLDFERLNFASTKLNVGFKISAEAVKADIKSIAEAHKIELPKDFDKWTGEELQKNLPYFMRSLTAEQAKALTDKLDAHGDKLGVATLKPLDTQHTIAASDIQIGTLEFGDEIVKVAADLDKVKADKVEKIDWAITESVGAHTLTIKDGSRVEVSTLKLDQGTLTVDDNASKLIVHNTSSINGTLNIKAGLVGLNSFKTMGSIVTAKDATTPTMPTLEINNTVKIGEKGAINIGRDAQASKDKEGAQLTFAGESTLKFDASAMGHNAIIVAEGKKGTLTATGAKVNLEAKNLSWGRYYLFDNFKTEGVTENTFVADPEKLAATKVWADQIKANGGSIKVDTNKDGQVSIVVGSDSVEGSGLNVNAKNLVSAVFKGDRASGKDLALVNELLSSGSSLDEISETINAVTGLGAVSGVKALTMDFAGYTADHIEHHAATMPHNMGGWWIQPLASKMKTDDLANGASTYGFSLDTVGIMGGYDVRLKDMTVGFAASYQSGDADSEGSAIPASTELTNKAAHLWLGKSYGETHVIGTLSYIKTDGDVSMSLGKHALASEIKATAWSAGVRAERPFKIGGFTLTPHLGARATMIDLDEYDIEDNKEALFSVTEDKATLFEVPVGVSIQTPTFLFQKFTVQPYVDVTLRGRFGDTDSSYTLTGSKTSDTIDYEVAGRYIGDLKLGYMSTYKNLNLGVSYGLSAGDAGRQNHSIEATMRVDF